MADARVSFKRKPGRPKVGATLVGVSLPPDALAPLDAWIAAQPEPQPTRPEAIRIALRDWLKARGGSGVRL
jgi:hypothetical protein